MILITRMDRKQVFINPDHIISIEETPDTVLTLFNGHHLIVIERAAVLIGRIEAFKAGIIRRSGQHGGKKYLRSARRKGYTSRTINRDNVYQDITGSRIPLHNQEL